MLPTVFKFSRRVLFASVLVLFGSNSFATGLMECEGINESDWQTKEALIAKLEAEGWSQIRKVKVDGGCYEAYATTPEGDKVEAYFNPQTFEKLLVARRGVVLFKKRVLFEKGVSE